MTHPFHSELIVPNLPKEIAVAYWDVVVELVRTSIPRQRQSALFRKQVVQLEFSKLEVQPRALEEVVQSQPDRFEMEGSGFVGRRDQQKRDVFLQRSCRQDIESGVIKPVRSK